MVLFSIDFKLFALRKLVVEHQTPDISTSRDIPVCFSQVIDRCHPLLNVSASQWLYECPSAVDFNADEKHRSRDVHDVDLVRVRLGTDLEKKLRFPSLDKASVFLCLVGLFSLPPMQNLSLQRH
jgi:hypothetical protein